MLLYSNKMLYNIGKVHQGHLIMFNIHKWETFAQRKKIMGKKLEQKNKIEKMTIFENHDAEFEITSCKIKYQ